MIVRSWEGGATGTLAALTLRFVCVFYRCQRLFAGAHMLSLASDFSKGASQLLPVLLKGVSLCVLASIDAFVLGGCFLV